MATRKSRSAKVNQTGGPKRSKNEGGIRLRSKSARISDSNFAGRDQIKGISGKDLNQIVKTLLKHFPKYYLQNPIQLDEALIKLRQNHEQLLEYKELHNRINDILIAFDQFKKETDRLLAKEINYELESLRTLWLPVSIRVDELLYWSQSIKHIRKKPGKKPFEITEKKAKKGEDWAVGFSEARDVINKHGLGSNIKHLPSFRIEEEKAFWLGRLGEYNGKFNSVTLTYLDLTDQDLLRTAQEILSISTSITKPYQITKRGKYVLKGV